MKIVSIVGARPQFVKCAILSRELRKVATEILVHTGQHYDDAMSGRFFTELGIPRPDFDLEIGSAPHGAQTGRMLEAIETVLVKVQPDWVLVFGDTNSTLAGALAATKMHIPVAHVEAGLRSYNRRMPEEVNRVLTDHASDLLFTPTDQADENLAREGVPASRVHQIGDVMYDAAIDYGEKAERQSSILEQLRLDDGAAYVLATIHRAENTDDPQRMRTILDAFIEIARDRRVVFTVHPRTCKALEAYAYLRRAEQHLCLVPPVGYLDMLQLERNAQLIVTDSGGVQKEAYFAKVPCVTLRDETEWPELISAGWNRLAPPTSMASVIDGVNQGMGSPGTVATLYGSGNASRMIAAVLASFHAKSTSTPGSRGEVAA